jgi:hypothetical protein
MPIQQCVSLADLIMSCLIARAITLVDGWWESAVSSGRIDHTKRLIRQVAAHHSFPFGSIGFETSYDLTCRPVP